MQFVDWDGRALKTEYVPATRDATAPDNPIREGYTFVGWDLSYQNVQQHMVVMAKYTAVVDPDPDPDPDPEPKPNPDPGSDHDPDHDSRPDSDPDPEPKPDLDPDPESKPNPDTKPEPDSNTDPSPNPDPDPDPDPDPNQNPEPNDPDDPNNPKDPEKPVVPVDPNDPDEPITAEDVNDKNDEDNTSTGANNKSELPLTGDKTTSIWILILVIAILGAVFIHTWCKQKRHRTRQLAATCLDLSSSENKAKDRYVEQPKTFFRKTR